jgi:hypothetical protein
MQMRDAAEGIIRSWNAHDLCRFRTLWSNR